MGGVAERSGQCIVLMNESLKKLVSHDLLLPLRSHIVKFSIVFKVVYLARVHAFKSYEIAHIRIIVCTKVIMSKRTPLGNLEFIK